MDQKKAPLAEAIIAYQAKKTVRFHVPGHKGRGEGILSSIFPYDVTEIPGLDDLHHPEEAIREAQSLAAEAFHAEETFFLVGGSTAGNIAMILTACKPGEPILVQRNVHKSVIHGLILAQAAPVYLQPEIDRGTGLPLTVALPELERMIRRHPGAKAVFLTNPNYYGMGVDLRPYAELCRQAEIPLLVDEAHGAHFGLAEGFPLSAIQAGAAAAVQSTHKMLSALTMASMLHVKGSNLNRSRLRQALAMVQSSSPSYPLMASLDLARRYIMNEGQAAIRYAVQLARKLKDAVERASIPWLEVVREGGFDFLDPLKITLQTRSQQMHGFALKEFLEDHGIYPELADEQHVLLALSPATTDEDIERTIGVFNRLDRQIEPDAAPFPASFCFAREAALTPHEVFQREPVTVPFEQAVGKISAEMIVPYPPGIPAVIAGERLDHEVMAYLRQLKELGCRFHGVSSGSLDTLRIIEEN